MQYEHRQTPPYYSYTGCGKYFYGAALYCPMPNVDSSDNRVHCAATTEGLRSVRGPQKKNTAIAMRLEIPATTKDAV